MRYLVFALLVMLIFSCTPKLVKEPPPVVEQPDVKYLWVFKKTINVRANNKANSDKVATLNDGDSVKVLQNINGWYKVILNDESNGWIRSDLLGTKNMSVFSKAISFSNNLKENENIILYFDKKIQHKRIFLEFPKNDYSSKKSIEVKTKDIGKRYQELIYSGKVSIHVIEPDNQSEYLTIILPGSANADINLPVFKFGILEEVNLQNQDELKLVIAVNENIKNTDMLKEARKIAGRFPLSFSQVYIAFKNQLNQCILSYKENSSGENYKFNQCL